MTLREHLAKHRSALLKQWFGRVADSYPADMAAILRKKQGFTNPIGQTISQGAEDILDVLISGADPATVAPFLDNIVRMRAVQDFTPSQAVRFVFLLKQVIREELAKPIRQEGLHDQLSDLDETIDCIGLMAFDIFMQCREKLYDIKANELRDRTLWLLKRANLVSETPDDPGDAATQGGGSDTTNLATKEVT